MKIWEIVVVIVLILIIIGILVAVGVAWYRGVHERPVIPTQPIQPIEPPSQPLSPLNKPTINYGDTIQLINQYAHLPLSSCGDDPGCSGTNNATTRSDTEYPTTQQWIILYGPDQTHGGPVKYGDTILLQNIWNKQQHPNTNQFLASCGDTGNNCGLNVVVGRTQIDIPSQTWTILGGANGSNVSIGDTVQLRNGYNSMLLSVCGTYEASGTCGYNVSLRTDDIDPISKNWTITK